MPEEVTRTRCHDCKQPLDPDSTYRCASCRSKRQKRRLERNLGIPADGSWRFRGARDAPDPAPAIRLRESLARLRAAGWPFPAAWLVAKKAALAEVTCPHEHAQWNCALASTKPAWRAAYEGTGERLGLSRELIDHEDDQPRSAALLG
jgi:hypothetical protein